MMSTSGGVMHRGKAWALFHVLMTMALIIEKCEELVSVFFGLFRQTPCQLRQGATSSRICAVGVIYRSDFNGDVTAGQHRPRLPDQMRITHWAQLLVRTFHPITLNESVLKLRTLFSGVIILPTFMFWTCFVVRLRNDYIRVSVATRVLQWNRLHACTQKIATRT
jgi:hypothetical protein